MFQLDLKSGVSICDQIVNGFIRLKALGAIKGGEQMPSVRVLASRFSVNPNTVQRAMTELEREGMVIRNGKNGNFYRASLMLTERGREAAEHVAIRATQAVETASIGLSEGNRRVLYAALELIASHLQKICDVGLADE